MRIRTELGLLAICAAALVVAGCQRDNHPRFPEGRSSSSGPSLGDYTVATQGGSADGLVGRSGGDGGNITLNVNSGELMLDDGRTLPSPTNNFLTGAVLDDGTVTYAELVSLQAPVVVGGLASFVLTGQGLFLTNGVRLDLSDAPNTGVTPATDVADVSISTDEAVRIDGLVVTMRTGNDAVGISFQTSHTEGVTLRGVIDTRAEPAANGGNVGLDAAAGQVIALGRIITSGGNATATLDAGDGGDVVITAGNGDMLLRAGSLKSLGGNGRLDGGNGGDVNIDFSSAAWGSFGWGIDSRAGDAIDGDGGNGGDVFVDGAASNQWFATFNSTGGDATTGIGGDGGDVTVQGFGHTGTLVVNGSGGPTTTGTGGAGSAVMLRGGSMLNMALWATVSGGRGDVGGDGGSGGIDSTGLVQACYMEVTGWGGHGISQAGDGGTALIQASSGSVVVQDTTIYGRVFGGNATAGPGGIGGSVSIQDTGATQLNTHNAVISGDANGGNGTTGGDAGSLFAGSNAGQLFVDVTGSADGGAGSAGSGGAGGQVAVTVVAGSIDAWFAASARGGDGQGGNGGDGGSFIADSATGGTTGGATRIQGTFGARGGSSDMDGGAGTSAQFGAGDSGDFTLYQMSLGLQGGHGDVNGGAGGNVTTSIYGSLIMTGGGIEVSGGNGGTGNSGDGGDITLETDEGDVQLAGQLRTDGGNGGTSGGNGGQVSITTDFDAAGDAGSVVIDAAMNLNGGSGTAGGTGGDFMVFASAAAGNSGNVLIFGSIRAFGGAGGAMGGQVYLTTDGTTMAVTGTIDVTGSADGDGGDVVFGDDTDGNPQTLTIGSTAIVRANGAGAGSAGTIDLNPAGAGPGNPNLVLSGAAILETDDGNGVDQSATNVLFN